MRDDVQREYDKLLKHIRVLERAGRLEGVSFDNSREAQETLIKTAEKLAKNKRYHDKMIKRVIKWFSTQRVINNENPTIEKFCKVFAVKHGKPGRFGTILISCFNEVKEYKAYK